jgi:hypothetical protein
MRGIQAFCEIDCSCVSVEALDYRVFNKAAEFIWRRRKRKLMKPIGLTVYLKGAPMCPGTTGGCDFRVQIKAVQICCVAVAYFAI